MKFTEEMIHYLAEDLVRAGFLPKPKLDGDSYFIHALYVDREKDLYFVEVRTDFHPYKNFDCFDVRLDFGSGEYGYPIERFESSRWSSNFKLIGSDDGFGVFVFEEENDNS